MEVVDEEMPELPPEIKINMKLDDIIKYDKARGAVSHNLQFKRRKNFNFREHRPFRPYRPYRRYRSQNWRLRGNGPNTSQWSHHRYPHVGKVRAFLEMKKNTSPAGSVFHRLGLTPMQQSARAKVWRARNYFRPQRPYFHFQKRFQNGSNSVPNRAEKLIQSAQRHKEFDGLGELIDDDEPEVKIEKLEEVFGGPITNVIEVQGEREGEVKTIITRQTSDSLSSFDERSLNSANSYYNGGTMYNRGILCGNNGYNGINSMNHLYGNGFGMYNMMPYHNVNMGMNNASGMYYNINGMSGTPMSGMYSMNMQNGHTNQMLNNPMNTCSTNNFNRMGMNKFNGSVNSDNSLSRMMSSLSQDEVIQRLNKPASTSNPGFGTSNVSLETDTMPVASGVPLNTRFSIPTERKIFS